MSLDVYLSLKGGKPQDTSGIWIRDNGQTKQITREEWDARHPDVEPVQVINNGNEREGEVYSANITHNLNKMAEEAGIYKHLWHPDEIGITKASELIAPLTAGLNEMRTDPKRFKAFNPPNGWGDYDGLCNFIQEYLNACNDYPDADVRTWT